MASPPTPPDRTLTAHEKKIELIIQEGIENRLRIEKLKREQELNAMELERLSHTIIELQNEKHEIEKLLNGIESKHFSISGVQK